MIRNKFIKLNRKNSRSTVYNVHIYIYTQQTCVCVFVCVGKPLKRDNKLHA